MYSVAMGSSGLHSNGYSLVRRVLLTDAGWALERWLDELGRTLGEELLEPTTIYAKPCLALATEAPVHAMAHITGGGLSANLGRALPAGVSALVERATWAPQPIFELVTRVGSLTRADVEATLNMGVGMVAVVAPEGADLAVRMLEAAGIHSWVCGEVAGGSGQGGVELVGDYAR